MAKVFDALSDKQVAFIDRQKMFFVATAARDGRITISPKGLDGIQAYQQDRSRVSFDGLATGLPLARPLARSQADESA